MAYYKSNTGYQSVLSSIVSFQIPMRFMKIILFILAIEACTSCTRHKYPFMDPTLGTDERVNDLVGRMTLEEKVGQMMNEAPEIKRLGIPAYNWWNECLHGVARAGLATSFPQAIGLGATWDEALMFRISTAISDEARAKHHDFLRKDSRLIYQGLTFWSPNINLFRDPRWGRGQETYGEDPFLTGRLGVQFVRGLQGDDPKYLKTIATLKHYAVHSGPEPSRHTFNAVISERDLRESYLPHFEMGIKEGKAWSVMCAYNSYLGEPCCGSNKLLNEILRKEWGFEGYVVSDCGAINDIYEGHKIVQTPEEASAIAVKSGCDLECMNVYTSLTDAVKKGLITEEEIDVSVKRLFTARFKLGMFDPPEMVKYASIPYGVVDCKAHKDLALEAARESIVLLKNENKLLPLKKQSGTIAVIGPNSDDWYMMLGNYEGMPSDPVTPLRGIREKLAGIAEVLYAKGCELATGIPSFEVVPPASLVHDVNQAGLSTEYFSNSELKGKPLFTATDSIIDASWAEGAPREDMDSDNFSVRWTGELIPAHSGIYELGVITSCKTNVYLNDSLVVNTPYHFRDEYGDPRLRKSDPVTLEAGMKYNIRIETIETYGDARIRLVWSEPEAIRQKELKKQAIDVAGKADVIIMCMGISPRLEGEEMDVKIEGFLGGDRTSLDIPELQEDLIEEMQSLGKPVVLVLFSGSALAVNREDKNVPAILEAWYPGQAGGTAIADVIFGDYNPGGRLPVTFYRSVSDLPPFEDYNMKGRTYRYFEGEPLYQFGYGLSYTTFSYDNLQVDKQCKACETVEMTVDVKNTGRFAGDEVVQVYLKNLTAKVPVPKYTLAGFKRIHLQPGETRNIAFSLPLRAFSVIDDQGQRVIDPGRFEIYAGGKQPFTPEGKPAPGVLKAEFIIPE
jgi:beta-glucosidase